MGTAVLDRFFEHLQSQVDREELSPYTARDRLQCLKQFVGWAVDQERIPPLRVVKSKDFSITVPQQKVITFTDDEVGLLLTNASESTRLYLLLMLNCGMTQADISDLEQEKVD